MLKTNKPLYKFVVILSLLCIVVCLVAAALSMFSTDLSGSFSLDGLFIILAMLAAAYYMLGGYSKNAARYYKIFTAFASLSALMTLLDACISNNSTHLILSSSVVFAITLYMAFSINQGKKRSYWFCGIAIVLRVLDLLVYIISAETLTTLVAFRFASYIVLACLLGVLTIAKYVDKDARGTI